MPQPWTYYACLRRGVDGDTFDVTLDTGFGGTQKERVRLLDIDAPERKTTTRAAGDAARDFVAAWLDAAGDGEWPLVVRTHRLDSLGRWLSHVWRVSDQRCLNDDLIESGHAVPYER